MIFDDFFKAVGQLGDGRFQKVLWLGLGLTVGLLFVVYAGFLWLMNALLPDTVSLPWIGDVTWIDNALTWASIPLMILLSVFLMVPVASAFTSIFLDEVAEAVEERHYPALSPAPSVPLAEALKDTLSFLGVIIGANIVALVLYLFLPFGAPFVFWALNGYLLGREYFQLVAMRRLGREGARVAQAKHGTAIWIAGILMAIPLSIPLVNLLVPILGAATFTHMFHRLEGTARPAARQAAL